MKKLLLRQLLLLITSCVRNIEYPDTIDYFESDFYSHFPKKINVGSSGYIVSASQQISNYHPNVRLVTKFKRDTIKSFVDQIRKKSIGSYKGTDTCLLVIDKHVTNEFWKVDKTARRKYEEYNFDYNPCTVNKYPIPKFYGNSYFDSIDKTSISGLIEKFEFFILSAESGIFMDTLKLPNGRFTPKDWKHGYSKGIAINLESCVIIYWSDIW